MRIFLDEQDVIDACCVYLADTNGRSPHDVEVDLQYREGEGVSASARFRFGWTQHRLSEQDIRDAVIFYLAQYHNFIPEQLMVNMQFNPQTGVAAEVLVQ
ncbi:MAG: YxcD family protein [Alicyclobacillus sp.]|nr:YxcD family protein [Alicyclobacillus sp.]